MKKYVYTKTPFSHRKNNLKKKKNKTLETPSFMSKMEHFAERKFLENSCSCCQKGNEP